MRLKVSVFNVENLFHRARAINKDNEVSAAILDDIEKLQKELEKTVYDKDKILILFKKVQKVIDINEDKGKLFRSKYRSNWRVVANGKDDWDGAITFRRDKFSTTTRGNTAQVIRDIDADIQGIVEAEDRIVLKQFNSQRLYRRFE